MITVKDRSNGAEGSIQHHGASHLRTSDPAANYGKGDATVGEGPTVQAPRIPSEKLSPEVSEVVGGGERCSAETANQGGSAGEGHINQGVPALSPVVVKLDGGFVVKIHGVASNPQIMRAHQLGSVTDADHKTVHRDENKCAAMGTPSSAGSTMPSVGKAVSPHLETGSESVTTMDNPGVRNRTSETNDGAGALGGQGFARLAETILEPGEGLIPRGPQALIPVADSSSANARGMTKAQKPVKFTQADLQRNNTAEAKAHQAAHSVKRPVEPVMLSAESETLFVGDTTQEQGEQARLDKVAADAGKPKMPTPVHLSPSHPAVYFGGQQRPMTSR